MQIPKDLRNLLALQSLNLSFNNLEGEVPIKEIFGNASAILVNGNDHLCGGLAELQLPTCTNQRSTKWTKSKAFRMVLATIGVVLDSDGFGSVYKGIINQDETIVAVKVLNLQNPKVYKSFMAECKALRNIRHRNLVKILTSCSSLDLKDKDFKALIYELVPNGSLDDWLHLPVDTYNHSRNLSLFQRLNIAIDVAFALNYLHHNCYVSIVHCDLKLSNVLLDSDITAHVNDFGLAKLVLEPDDNLLLEPDDNLSQTQTKYGLGARATIQGDVFSYVILLLEMFTGKRPTDHMFTDDLNLRNFAKEALPVHVMQILDPTLLPKEEESEEIEEYAVNRTEGPSHRTNKLQDCITSIIEIALQCSMESSKDRMNMNGVVMGLHSIRENFS
ncbi:receptor kinase-like protein Xa21 [Macadamia integrifolia]|uniref:receptor kinase-like protein Xa21 n=1 Tax=Macadamia integrifolia TaxID=60698 RepID=UPI001C4F0B01|nr:receptor kinase-like protein Xa21 [Macadamia integrifolia]